MYSWEPTYFWVSLDVNSSIPHDIGIHTVQHFLVEDPFLNFGQPIFIVDATRFGLQHNYFQFDGDSYLQVNSTVMGANFAPSYTNLTMGYGSPSQFGITNHLQLRLFSMVVILTMLSSSGMALVLRHNCSRKEDYVTHNNLLKKKFLENGYLCTLIEEAYSLNSHPVRFTTQI